MIGAWGLFLASVCVGSAYALLRRRWLNLNRSRGEASVGVEMSEVPANDAHERRRARTQRQLMVASIMSKQLLDSLIPATPYSPSFKESHACRQCSSGGEAKVVAGPGEAAADVQGPDEKYEEDICTVCIEKYRDGEAVRKLFCNHIFHKDCVDPWLLKNGSCPVCRQDIVAFPDTPPPHWATNLQPTNQQQTMQQTRIQ